MYTSRNSWGTHFFVQTHRPAPKDFLEAAFEKIQSWILDLQFWQRKKSLSLSSQLNKGIEYVWKTKLVNQAPVFCSCGPIFYDVNGASKMRFLGENFLMHNLIVSYPWRFLQKHPNQVSLWFRSDPLIFLVLPSTSCW